MNGDYCPENCRWADSKTQTNNARNNVLITVDGVTHTRTQWADLLGVSMESIRTPMRKGVSGEEAVRSIMEAKQ